MLVFRRDANIHIPLFVSFPIMIQSLDYAIFLPLNCANGMIWQKDRPLKKEAFYASRPHHQENGWSMSVKKASV